MGEENRKGKLWRLFRTRSSTVRNGKLGKEPRFLRRASDGHGVERDARNPPCFPDLDSPTHHTAGRSEPVTVKGKGRQQPGLKRYDRKPLTEWPPAGFSIDDELSLGNAMELICRGVPVFRGHKRPIPHASDHYFALFATVAGNKGDETDAADAHESMTQLMTMRILGSRPITRPWETLEQPSYSFWFGTLPGTITLNHWVFMSSVLPPTIGLRDPGVTPREAELDRILERIQQLEKGLEEDDVDLMYKNLYRKLLRDPDRLVDPHKTLDKQITDLIVVLSGSDWIDFSAPKHQIVTRFIFETDETNHDTYVKFFHQLVLSIELDLRINSRQHLDQAKEHLLSHIPPKIQWSIALARRWRDYVRIRSYGKTADQVRLRLKLKKRQVRMLKRFAQMMKWPNLTPTINVLERRDADSTLDLISSHAMAFFSGLILPGATFPFLIMNSLIDLDPDPATDELALLTHLHPHCGFQYRNSYTYWTATSIVGKVLAPTCRAVAGWVGPARPTVDLEGSQIARIRCRRPQRQRDQTGRLQQLHLLPEDVRSMSDRSDPLGPPVAAFPVREYILAMPESDPNEDYSGGCTAARIDMLLLKRCADRTAESGPSWFDASVQFAVDGTSHKLRLNSDVYFISAWPCSDGPHPLFFDYVYVLVRAERVLYMEGWNGGPGDAQPTSRGASGGWSKQSGVIGKTAGTVSSHLSADDNEDKVLVVEAFGLPDNEVLVRAWCSQWGLSALVADIDKTCMACAIREAYAATLSVVILVSAKQTSDSND